MGPSALMNRSNGRRSDRFRENRITATLLCPDIAERPLLGVGVATAGDHIAARECSQGLDGGLLAPEGSFVEMAVDYLQRVAMDATRH